MRNSESNANRELAKSAKYLAESIRGVRAPKRERSRPVTFSGHYVIAGLVFIAVLMLGVKAFT